MAFEDDLARHVDQIKARLPHVRGEEATKQSLVVPLFHVLGYDVWNPLEVQPEYGSDFNKAPKKGQIEKVDYALKLNGDPVIFVECKAVDCELDNHDGQLARYFNATPSVRVGILTNGVRIKVFTDLQQPNVMDDKPWMNFDLRTAKQAEVDALKRFRKTDFTADQIIGLAEEMVYYNVLVPYIASQLRDPGEKLVRLVAEEIPSIKRIDKKIVDRLTPILRKAIQSAILDHVARSFNAHPEPVVAPPPAPVAPPPAPKVVAPPPAAPKPAAATPSAPKAAPPPPPAAVFAPPPTAAPMLTAPPAPPMLTASAAVTPPPAPSIEVTASGSFGAASSETVRDRVSTTPEELDVYSQVTTIVKEVYPDASVLYRDAKSYFTIMQKNLRKWFIRLGIERQPFWITFRHVKAENARSLCPEVDVTDGGQLGDSKIVLKSTADIQKLKPIILASYAAEAARIADVGEAIGDNEPPQ